MENSLTTAGIKYLPACHTIYKCKVVIGREGSQLITVEMRIEAESRLCLSWDVTPEKKEEVL